MKKIIVLIFISTLTFALFAQNQVERPYVVMISMDGFRWDYPDKVATPNLHYVAKHGVKAQSLRPAFPTKTFPNHYAMATGLYPDHNGIVNNSFYDPEMNAHYSMGDSTKNNPAFYLGEPIWNTAEKQGVKTASFYWVGSDVAIQGMHPTYWKKYVHLFPFEQRLDTAIAWLSLPEEKRPHLILLYLHEPDAVGHDFGPDGEKTLQEVHYLDSLVGDFIKKIKKLPVGKKVNLIFTADHGMCNIANDRVVYLSDFVKKNWFKEIEGGNPNYNLKANPGCLDSAYQSLIKVPHIKVWKHGMLPQRLHYGNSPRDLDLIVVSDSAWSVSWKKGRSFYGGTHGFDNSNTDIHAIFYAMGPAFKKGYVQPTFDNVDLYPLITYILGIRPAATDGNLEAVKSMLK